MSNYKGGVRNRRNRVLGRLLKQLEKGTRPAKSNELIDLSSDEFHERVNKGIPLKEKDIKRIKKEIEILKNKI